MFKFKSFFWKIWFFVLVLTTVFLALLLGILINYQVQREKDRFLQQHLNIAQIIAHSLERGYKTDIWPFEALGRVSETESTSFLWVVKPDNKIFWADNKEMMGQNAPIPYDINTEIKDIFFGESVKLITLPVETKLGKDPWVLLFGVSLNPIAQTTQRALILSISLLFLLLILASIISYFFSKKITAPLQRLQEGTKKIGEGQLNYRVNIKTGDELEDLGSTFNQMAESLHGSHNALKEAKASLEIKVKARTKELRKLNENLEEEVQGRTKDLQGRFKELERFQRLTVGRELKMIELKKEIKELEKEIKRLKE